MSKILHIFCFVMIALLAVFNANVKADEIKWAIPVFPPYFFDIDKRRQEKGIGQHIVDYLISRLPSETEHAFFKATYARAIKDIVGKKPVIITSIIKNPERIKQGALYSKIPPYIILPNEVVIREEDYSKVGKFITQGKLDLDSLLLSKSFKVEVNTGRLYSSAIDDILNKHREFLLQRPGAKYIGSLKMLNLNRIDAMIGFPVEIGFILNQLGIDKERFRYLKV